MEDAQEQWESSQAELAKKHPLTPLKELPEESEEEEEEDESSAGAQREADSNNSIMGKMKRRVSSILPASLSGWFSPSSKDGNDALSSPANLRQSQPRQSNGRSTTKRKRGRRRIMLAEADADAADDLDDGSDAKGLNYEEVALADNIAEHDLAAEDEQTRRSEYNVFLLRKRAGAVTAAGCDEDEAEEDELEEDDEEGDEEDDDEEQENLQQSARVQTKRRRLELETPVNLPNMRRLPLLSSTPAAPLAAATSSSSSSSSQMYKSVSQLAPHRRNHLNLYGNQRQREPAYNFFTGNEAAEGSTGDLPHSIRRSLNIPFGGSSTATSYNNSLSSLPNHKRPPLIGKRTHRRDLTMDETETGPAMSSEEHLNHLLGISRTNNNTSNNNNNNNNNVIKTKTRRSELSAAAGGGGDSQSESDLNECHDNGEGHEGLRRSHYSSNSNLEFYGNLQSSKSIFNRSNAAAQQSHRNSTWSLNSLTQRRRFNASIYGSTSALSDSRLLSGSASNSGSASASSSPFYQGRTTFGGYSGNNRLFSRSNLSSSAASSIMGLNSAGSSPAHPLHASMTGGIGYGIKAVDMRPSDSGNLAATSVGQCGSKKPGTGLSNTTMRILNLLESYSTPLIDAKRMGSSIKEHQTSRQQRLGTPATPYLRSTSASSNAPVPNHINELAELRSNKLLVPTMQQLLERRRLHRVTQNSRDVVHSRNVRAGGENNEEKPKQAAPYVAPIDQSSNHTHHTNKMRSRLSHQTRNKEPRTAEEEAPPPLELPQISFPEMASAPKFDLIIKPTVPVVSKPSTTDPIPSSKSISSNLSTTNSKQMPNFLANPQPAAPIVNFAANGNVPAISEPTRRTFTFSEPIPLSNFRENCILKTKINRNFTFPSPASLDDLRTTNEQSQPTINGTPSSKEWECDTCMVRNKPEVNKCVACETAKPVASAATAQAPSAPPTAAIETQSFGGFGDRFKKSTTDWECDACMLSNKAEASKCIACETPRKTVAPKVNNFSPLITNAKSNEWECSVCLVRNKVEVSKCVASSSVPKFRFGFSHVKEVVKPSVETTTTPAPTSAQFSFGFGQSNQGKDVADSKKTEAPKTFSFGVSKVEEPKTVTFGTDIKETTATSSSEATAPAAAAAPLQFVFKAPTTATTASSSITTTISTTSNAPALGGFRFDAPSSSSAVSSSTASTSVNPAAVKPMFSFSGAGSAVSSTSSSQQPVAKATTMGFGVSSGTVATTTTSTKVFAFTPASAPAPSAATSTPAPAAGLTFGSQSKPATTQNTGTFFFGQPTAAAPATPTNSSVSSIFGAPATSTTANTSVSATTTTANAIASSFATTSTPQLFGNWGENKTDMTTSSATKPFTFGAPSVSGTTTTPSFGWSSNGDAAKSNSVAVGSAAVPSSSASKMATPIFGSSSMFGPSSSSNNTTSTTSLPFGSAATTAATTQAAGGNGPLTGIFGNVGNSLVGVGAPVATTPAATAAAPLANFFGNPTPVAAAAPVFGSGSTITSAGFGAPAAAAPLAGTALPGAFNFGGATAATPAASSAPYKFGSSTNEPLAKPAFNFTGSAASSTAPAPAFNFSANTAATNLTDCDCSKACVNVHTECQCTVPIWRDLRSASQYICLQSDSRWQLGAEFPNGSPQNPCPRTPSAAPVEMASQSAITIANEAAVGLGLGFRVPLPRAAGSAVAEAEASRAEDTGDDGGNNSELNGSVQSQYHQEPDIQGSSRMYMQPRQPPFVNKYRFVRRRHSLDGSTNAVVPFSRNKWRRTAELNTAGEGHKTSGGDVPETPTPLGDQEDNHQEGRHSPVYTSTKRTVLVRTQFKIVRQRSVISKKK
ncbi:GM13448 [Drosophila sechellia]|uniref:Nuclear pore complex protein Nup153 n=1 Tax=Drosophila sechellia TaxID=7238 RepID=B4IF98_DROSE|nr:GM13448 [Drosophila sechellia]